MAARKVGKPSGERIRVVGRRPRGGAKRNLSVLLPVGMVVRLKKWAAEEYTTAAEIVADLVEARAAGRIKGHAGEGAGEEQAA